MPQLIVYLLKVNVALILFYVAYRFILRRLTFYYLNRLFLVFGIVFSSVYPFINVSNLFIRHQELSRQLLVIAPDWHAIAPAIGAKPAAFDYWQIPVALFWIGVLVMALRFVTQLFSLYKIHRHSKTTHLNGQPFRALQHDVNPFSFWRYIYINPLKHAPEELSAVLKHEQVHVKQWHTADVLLSELNAIFYWFNPGVWFMKQAVKENLEFITDREILQSGIDEKAYQYSLVRVSNLRQGTAIVNNFNFLNIKKRIMMMNKKRSSKGQITRYVVILPLVVLLALIFTVSKAELNGKTFSALVKKVLPKAMVNTAAEAKATIATKDTTHKTSTLTATSKAISGSGTLSADIVPITKGESFTADDSTHINKQTNTVTLYGLSRFSTGTGQIQAAHVLKIDNNGKLDMNKALIFVDGKQTKYADLDMTKVDSATILKSDDAVSAYGNKGKYGAVVLKYTTGPDIKGKGNVTAEFDGDVLKTVEINGTYLAIIKKGDKFGAYSNLQSVNVAKGDKVSKGDIIGTVELNTRTGKPDLNYELYKGSKLISATHNDTLMNNSQTKTTLACTVLPEDMKTRNFKAAIKLFKQNGFTLNFDGTTDDQLKVSVRSDHKSSSASAIFLTNDMKNDHFVVKIKVDKETGAVSVASEDAQ